MVASSLVGNDKNVIRTRFERITSFDKLPVGIVNGRKDLKDAGGEKTRRLRVRLGLGCIHRRGL